MTATQQSTATKLTDFARDVSENSRIAVVFRNGCFWLILLPVEGSGDCTRTLQAVGTAKTGIKYAREQITSYFEEK